MAADTAIPILLLLFTLLFRATHGLSQEYCSNQNSASDTAPTFWQYQSNGWCHDHCSDSGGYAFAIVQDSNCWCSNLIPSNQQDVSDCSDTCPGFGQDNCGNKGAGLFGYVPINGKASGTYYGPAVSQSSASQTSSTPAPITTIQVITESGAAITKTVTIMPTDPSGQMEQTKKSSSSGVIAGAVVGAIVGLAVIIGVLIWCLWFQRRKLKRDQDPEKTNRAINGMGQATPQRHPSTLSKAGLLRTENVYPTLNIPGPTRHSSNGTDGISPVSGGGSSDRRHSKPLFYDQRLNPSALMDLDNGSHTSIVTMEDNKDYTRTLNVRNPDPPDA